MTSIKISKQSLEDVIHEVERKADVPPDQNSDSITPIRNTSNESTVREERGFEEPGPSFENTNGTLTLRQTETFIKEEPLDQSYENTQNSIVPSDQNLKRTFEESIQGEPRIPTFKQGSVDSKDEQDTIYSSSCSNQTKRKLDVHSEEIVSNTSKKPKQNEPSAEQGPSTSTTGRKSSVAEDHHKWRPKKTCYKSLELFGIVPDYIITAFHADKDLVRLIIFFCFGFP